MNETKPACFGSKHTTRQTVLYISNFITDTHEPLRELSDIGGNCAVLMVAFFIPYEQRMNGNLTFFDWLPFHRLIAYSTYANFLSIKIRELLPSHNELFKLIENPGFNRFEYYEKTLVPDFRFSDILRSNSTKRLFVLLDWISLEDFLDLDTVLHFLNILRRTVGGMSFEYRVIPRLSSGAHSKTVQKIIHKLHVPMFFKQQWLIPVNRTLVLTIGRKDLLLSRLPDKEIIVKFKSHCQERLDFGGQPICNADFLREDNVRSILQSIDSHFVNEERKLKGIS